MVESSKKCIKYCPDSLTLYEAQLSPYCWRAMEYGLCRKWTQEDKIGLKYSAVVKE